MKKLLMLHRHRPWRPASGQSTGHRDDNASFNTSGGVRWQPSRWSGARNNPNTAERRQIQMKTAAMTRQRKMTTACHDDGYISTPTSSSICPVDATITTTSIALLPISGNIHVRQRQNVSVIDGRHYAVGAHKNDTSKAAIQRDKSSLSLVYTEWNLIEEWFLTIQIS